MRAQSSIRRKAAREGYAITVIRGGNDRGQVMAIDSWNYLRFQGDWQELEEWLYRELRYSS